MRFGWRSEMISPGPAFRACRWMIFWVLLVLLSGLVYRAPAALGNDDRSGVKSVSPVKEGEYRLREKAPAGPDSRSDERFGMGEIFPLYGSREEMIFKPWLRVFYYNKQTGFRLNVEYENETEE